MEDESSLAAQYEESNKAWRLLYLRIGLCITVYQSIEDRLEDFYTLFSADQEQSARGIFALMSGLERKLTAISHAAANHGEDVQRLWSSLQKDIKRAADNRNQIAHSNPIVYGGTFVFNDDFQLVERRQDRPYVELRKITKSGEARWDAERLLSEFHFLERLGNRLTVLYRYVADGAISEHMRAWWNDPAVQRWPTK